VVTLDGSLVRTERQLLNELGKVLVFPEYYGVNWDAFNECFRDFAHSREGATALVWRRSDVMATENLPEFVRAVHLMLEEMSDAGTLDRHRQPERSPVQVELFVTGTGPAYAPGKRLPE
jgi:hypothetical protein